jgi:large subunit ribosomal protein L25
MEAIELRTASRTVHGKQVKKLRTEGLIPAVVYSGDLPAQSIQIESRALSRVLRQAGSTTLINLYVDESSQPHVVLAREIQRDPLTGEVLHTDFFQVRLTEKVKTTPRLEFVGESPLVRSGTAVLLHGVSELEVECLPTDLIHSIEVDISALQNLEDTIQVRDLAVPPGVTILAPADEVVASLVTTRAAIGAEAEEGEEGAVVPESEE